MGVPAFYRWISEKYAKIVVDMLEKRPTVIDGTIIPIDLRQPNPNEVEYDNLYVDMNGLIHPCSHPEDREAPKTEEEMYHNITLYVDRLVAAVRPRKVLFMAIDGVAPRAKMNQQRSRRFRAAQDAAEKSQAMENVLSEMREMGYDTSEQLKNKDNQWDSNVITPGTAFMERLSDYLRAYILDRMNRNPYWRGITVILSDASEPGEGEHKIMDYIRSQRNQEDYDPNCHHILHGLDADLIMLALATHESRFTILREKVVFGRRDREKDEVCEAQRLLDAQSMQNGRLVLSLHQGDDWVFGKALQALHVHVLREYLDNEFSILKTAEGTGQNGLPFKYDLERIIDDFIFMCFFVGNDFLPHLPSLDIRDGALDFLMECYKELLPSLGDYLTSPGGVINLLQADILLSKVGEIEDEIFSRKKRAEDNFERRMDSRRLQRERENAEMAAREVNTDLPPPPPPSGPGGSVNDANQEAADRLRNSLASRKRKGDELSPKSVEEEESAAAPTEPTKIMKEADVKDVKEELAKRLKTKEQEMFDTYKKTVVDGVRLHERGWKDRYYNEPHKKENIEEGGGLANMCLTYVQGLCWVLQYYYSGVPSWNWYYPFHYAPFASDLVNLDAYGDKVRVFEKSCPFRPLEQLLAVLPASSAHALPDEVSWLMTSPKSPIIDLYSTDVEIDPNGKHLPWLWIVLLPFIDERRISAAFDLCRPNLTRATRERNKLAPSVIFVHQESALGKFALENSLTDGPDFERDPMVLEFLKKEALALREGEQDEVEEEWMNPPPIKFNKFGCKDHQNVSGAVTKAPAKWFARLGAPVTVTPAAAAWLEPIDSNKVIVLTYSLPPAGVHRSVYLEGAEQPPSQLHPSDLQMRRPPRLNKSGFSILELFHSKQNEGRGGRNGYGSGYGNGYGNGNGSGYGNRRDNQQNAYSQYGRNVGGLLGMHQQYQQGQQAPPPNSYNQQSQFRPGPGRGLPPPPPPPMNAPQRTSGFSFSNPMSQSRGPPPRNYHPAPPQYQHSAQPLHNPRERYSQYNIDRNASANRPTRTVVVDIFNGQPQAPGQPQHYQQSYHHQPYHQQSGGVHQPPHGRDRPGSSAGSFPGFLRPSNPQSMPPSGGRVPNMASMREQLLQSHQAPRDPRDPKHRGY